MICLIAPENNANNDVPNIGLAYISAALNKLNTDNIIVDQAMMPYPKDRFMIVEAETYGISVKFNIINEVKRITNLLHMMKPNAKIIWGGPHMKNSEIVEELKKEFPYVEFKAGYYDQELLDTMKLDDIPFPCYDNFDSYDYLMDNFRSGFWRYPIMTSRGCPFQCKFCNSDKNFNARTAQNCIDELKHAVDNYGIKHFQILDDNFIMVKDRALEFCEKIKPFNLNWMCPNGIRADLITEELAKAMSEAGCTLVSFGVECADDEVLKSINKGETLKQITDGINIAKNYFHVAGFFIIGLPGSSYEKDLASYEWSKKMGITGHFGIFVPIPGTKAEQENKEFVDYDLLNKAIFFDDKHDMVVAYETPEYPKAKRLELYNMIMGARKR